VTLSPKGRTYITVGAGGFYYRQNLSSGTKPTSPRPDVQPVPEVASLDEIKTADVEELRDSSKSELVEDLNERAKMFNPASIVFALAAIGTIIGVFELASSAPSMPLALPQTSSFSDTSRQANRTDEYALLLARYGQPSTVETAQAGTAPLRLATWERAHLIVSFVPAGCVDAYTYYQAHKSDPLPRRGAGRRRAGIHRSEPASPACILSDKASTVVAYEDSASHSAVDSQTAEHDFAGLSTRSAVPPTLKAAEPIRAKPHAQKTRTQPTVEYDEATLRSELGRLRNIEISDTKDAKVGYGFLVGALLLLIPGAVVQRKNKEKRITRLIYDLSDSARAQQQELESALTYLTRSGAIWRLDSQSAVVDWKRNAGAAYNVKRERISVRRTAPPRVESNIVPLCLDLKKLKLFFLPDQVLYWQRDLFASIEYNDLKLDAGSTRFIEESIQTSDSRQVGTSWRYVRKDGGPDRRFNNNRQLPVMLYGVVSASSFGGLNLVLHTSNMEAASSFATTFKTFQSDRARDVSAGLPPGTKEDPSNRQHPASPSYPADIVQAMTVLGIKPGVTLEQVAIAYRHMAQMYHPDKTAGLGPELQKLADERMKEINSAHQTVKRYLEHA
jgi:PAS domain-containing protein